MSRTRPSFVWLLPIAVPLLCWTALASLITLNYCNLRQTSVNGSAVSFHSHQYAFTVPRNKFFLTSAQAAAHTLSYPIQSINLPGMFGEVITDFATRTWPDSYRPAAFGPLPVDLFMWRGIIFPAYCIPFWWFAGLGLEAFLKTRTLRWPTLLAGTLLCAFYLVICMGLLCMAISEHDFSLHFVFVGFAIWLPLTATFPLVWIRQLRQRRATRRNPLPQQPTDPPSPEPSTT